MSSSDTTTSAYLVVAVLAFLGSFVLLYAYVAMGSLSVAPNVNEANILFWAKVYGLGALLCFVGGIFFSVLVTRRKKTIRR